MTQSSTAQDATTAAIPAAQSGQMSHREILEAMSGLLLAMFVAMLSSTVVSNALPRIVTDLHGEILAEHTRPAPGIRYVGSGRPPGTRPKNPATSPKS